MQTRVLVPAGAPNSPVSMQTIYFTPTIDYSSPHYLFASSDMCSTDNAQFVQNRDDLKLPEYSFDAEFQQLKIKLHYLEV